MKLIDLLVKELPKSGGWPNEAVGAHWIKAIKKVAFIDREGYMPMNIIMGSSNEIDSEAPGTIVTKSEYESALAASDGWIEWGGGECPVDSSCLVDLKFRNGATEFGYSASAYYWENANLNTDIIAYRLHSDTSTRAKDDRLEQDLNECIGQHVKGVALGFGGNENPLSGCAVWDGIGIPPVGCACEYSLNSGVTWFNCKIDYILGTQGLIMLADVFEGGQWVSFHEYDGKLKFRPLRTEEENVREKAIQELSSVICGNIPDTGMATATMYATRIYDAGYRKEGK